MLNLINQIVARAKANRQRIVLPEGTEERTLKAADKLIADKVAHITLIGNPAEIMALAEKHGLQNIGNAIIVDPKNHERKEEYANLLFELRKKKGMTEDGKIRAVKSLYGRQRAGCFFLRKACKRKVDQPLYRRGFIPFYYQRKSVFYYRSKIYRAGVL